MVENGLQAIGRVKENNMYSVPVYLLSIPMVWGCLNLASVLLLLTGLAVSPLISFMINMILLSKYSIFPGWKFFTEIFLKNTGLIVLSAIVPFILQRFMGPGLLRFLVVCTVSVMCTFVTIWTLGMNKATRQMFIDKISNRFQWLKLKR